MVCYVSVRLRVTLTSVTVSLSVIGWHLMRKRERCIMDKIYEPDVQLWTTNNAI